VRDFDVKVGGHGVLVVWLRMKEESEDPLVLENQLCFSVYATSLAITQFYKPLLEFLGLTYPQYLIMLILWREDGLPLSELASRLGQKSGALTPVVKRMAEQGLLTRGRNEEDERQLQIFLTPQGLALRHQALTVNRCVSERCGLGATQQLALKTELDALRERFLAG
jgi:DNA-binding MarR family transcriptional regulator